MNVKYELAQYLANLLAIIDSKEDTGQDRGGTVAREYERAYGELRETITKEEKENDERSAKPTQHTGEPVRGLRQDGRNTTVRADSAADRGGPREPSRRD